MKGEDRSWFNPFLIGLMFVAALALGGCKDGDDGADGVDGIDGVDGVDATKLITPEQCETCHSDDGFNRHMADYAMYNDNTTLTLEITNVTSVALGTVPETYDATMTFFVTENGQPYQDGLPGAPGALASMSQLRFYTTIYDDVAGTFSTAFDQGFSGPVATATPGEYTVTASGMSYAPENANSQAYGYIAKNELNTEIKDLEGSHVSLYSDVASDGWTPPASTASTYDSAANVDACEKCHGTPYRKHGYREASVDGLGDFASCKNCHMDDHPGGHEDWQILVDNPRRYVEIANGDSLTPAEETQYAYTRKLMNDVHMAHSMEFPYPQSMATCNTCHENKLVRILDDSNFTLPVCKSCHAMTGPATDDDVAQEFVSTRAPAFAPMFEADGLTTTHSGVDNNTDCTVCHGTSNPAGQAIARSLGEYHTGYNSEIYSSDGTKYNDAITTTIDDVTMSGYVLTISFHAVEGIATPLDVADMVPNVLVGLYGYDTKDFIVSPHSRDENRERLLEYDVGTVHPRMATVSNPGDGTWVVTADLSTWSDMIDSGVVRRVEVAVRPRLDDANGTAVALDAQSSTFDLITGMVDNAYFHDNEIVKVEGCNNCHDALATTFHTADRGGNITVCRMCHVGLSGGSHLEMQSRSIDSYVHAVHSFQAFDIDQIDFTDPLLALEYEHHIAHTFPNFTIKNCYACHNEGTNEVPDQSKSMPGILSGSEDHAVLVAMGLDRNIGDVPEVVTGPAGRACGGCHRAQMIKADDAGKLTSFYQHKSLFGYTQEDQSDPADGLDDELSEIIDTILSLFE